MRINTNTFQILAPYAAKLEALELFYGIRMGHYCNKRQTGYIEVDFDFKRIAQFEHKIREIETALDGDNPFKLFYLNTFDEEKKCTFSTLHLFLKDDLTDA